ncbi:ABC transporter permease [Paraclostridium bifermentans]
MLKWEIKKLFKNKSILISSIILILLCAMMSILSPDLETENSYADDKGNYISDTRSEFTIANEKLNYKIMELKELKSQKNLKNSDELTKKVSEMADLKLEKDSGKEYKDVSFYKVFNYRVSNMLTSIVIVGIIIYIFSNIYTDEKLSNVDSIILSSKNKSKALFSKISLSIILPVALYLIYVLLIGCITMMQYGQPVNGALQVYRMTDVVALIKPVSINAYTAQSILTMMILFISTGIFASLFSFITKNSVESIVGITVFLVIGKLLTLMKFLPAKLMSIINYSNYIDIIMHPEMVIGNYMGNISFLGQSVGIVSLVYIVLGALLLVGIGLNIYVFRKVLTK